MGRRSIAAFERGENVPHQSTLKRLIEALALPPHEQARFESAAQPSPRRRPSTAIPEPTHLVPVPQGERTAPHNLFPSLTSFIGREEEMRRITSLLTTARLV